MKPVGKGFFLGGGLNVPLYQSIYHLNIVQVPSDFQGIYTKVKPWTVPHIPELLAVSWTLDSVMSPMNCINFSAEMLQCSHDVVQ